MQDSHETVRNITFKQNLSNNNTVDDYRRRYWHQGQQSKRQ